MVWPASWTRATTRASRSVNAVYHRLGTAEAIELILRVLFEIRRKAASLLGLLCNRPLPGAPTRTSFLGPGGRAVIGFRRVRIDRADGRAEVERLDGAIFAWRTRAVDDVVASAELDLVARRCVLERTDGAPAITVDFPATVFARPPGPIVYLDQNRWINVARAVLKPEQVTPASERKPAEALADAAHGNELTLPLAAAHLVELAQAGSARRRRELGGVMADLSSGWFMRSPLAVRREETTAALRARTPRPTDAGPRPPVFTCSPVGFFSSQSTAADPEPDADFGGHSLHGIDPAGQMKRLDALLALVATIVDERPLDTTAGRAASAGWARGHDELGQFLGTTPRSRGQRQLAVRARVLADLGDELAIWAWASGMSLTEFGEWFKVTSESDLRRMPYMGRVHEVVQLRLANRDDRWEGNDLTDLHFLSCAAGYADVVVAERKHGNYLRRVAPRVTSGAEVFTSLRDAAELLSMV
jgi:hypothetical protein